MSLAARIGSALLIITIVSAGTRSHLGACDVHKKGSRALMRRGESSCIIAADSSYYQGQKATRRYGGNRGDTTGFYRHQQSNGQTQKAAQGNTKITVKKSMFAVFVAFALLLVRSTALIDMADRFAHPAMRHLAIAASATLIIVNVLGVITNFMRPAYSKAVMKSLFGLNLIKELIEFIYNLINVVVRSPSAAVPAEVLQGRMFSNAVFMSLYFGMIKSRWFNAAESNQNNASS
jgi:hypothetical protein